MQRDRARSSPNLTFGVRSGAPPTGSSRPPPVVGGGGGGFTSSPMATPTGGGSFSGAPPPPPSGPPQRRKSSIRIAVPAAPPAQQQHHHHHQHYQHHHDDIPMMESDEGSVGSEQVENVIILPPPPKQPTRRASVAAMQRSQSGSRGGTPQEFDDYYYSSNGRGGGGGGPQEELLYRQAGGRGQEANAVQQLRSFQFPSEPGPFAGGGSPSYSSGGSAAARRSPPSSVHLSASSPQRQVQPQSLSSSQLGAGTRPSPSPQLHNQVPPNPLRNPHAKVSGVELHAPLPRLQATSERAADRTRDMVFQFMEQLCPERAAAVQKVMDQFSGREALLMEAITSIFGDEWATHQRRQQTLMLQQAAEDDAKAFLPVAYRHVPQAVRTTEVLLAPTNLPPRSPEYSSKADVLRSRDGSQPIADSGRASAGPYGGSAVAVHNVADEPLSYGGPAAIPLGQQQQQQHPVGINSSRSQTPNHSNNPLPPLPAPSTVQQYAAVSASKDLVVRSSENSLASTTTVDPNDPIAAVMATPTAAGGIMTPPVPPELVYRGGLPATGISSSTWR